MEEIIRLGELSEHIQDRIYSVEGIAPCICVGNQQGAYNNQPRILIQYGAPIKF